MVSVVTMKTATAEDEGLPIVFLDIDDVLCLNNPYGGFDALEAVNGRHADLIRCCAKSSPRSQSECSRACTRRWVASCAM